jgi:hypothetical protein
MVLGAVEHSKPRRLGHKEQKGERPRNHLPTYTRGDICPASTRWRLRLLVGGSTGGHARPASPPHICSTPFDHTQLPPSPTPAHLLPRARPLPQGPQAAGQILDRPVRRLCFYPELSLRETFGPVISWPVGHLDAVFNRTQFPTPHPPHHLPPPGHTPLPRGRATRIISPPAGPDLQSQASAVRPSPHLQESVGPVSHPPLMRDLLALGPPCCRWYLGCTAGSSTAAVPPSSSSPGPGLEPACLFILLHLSVPSPTSAPRASRGASSLTLVRVSPPFARCAAPLRLDTPRLHCHAVSRLVIGRPVTRRLGRFSFDRQRLVRLGAS